MSRLLPDFNSEFENGDAVSFVHEGELLYGEVVRVYNTRYHYHVEVNGQRYEVSLDDDMKLASLKKTIS